MRICDTAALENLDFVFKVIVWYSNDEIRIMIFAAVDIDVMEEIDGDGSGEAKVGLKS